MADRSSSISSSSSGSMIIEYESGEEEGEAIEGVHPYMFEPEGSISGSNSDNEDSDVEVELRTMNDDWCECGGHCQRQDTERECVCCKEIDNVTCWKLHGLHTDSNLVDMMGLNTNVCGI
ncbi:uncharacterized protein LOC110234266 [Exaiptasia diaphana]|uniref:Uncharacterized protein n=1 Tax=Exaiptasia diaphana TaxID=2652724 RepID=A0A913YG72_EXADI|nr:uncharacterized protein LOC110234266 [Exaiptasia diaphana]